MENSVASSEGIRPSLGCPILPRIEAPGRGKIALPSIESLH
jgi:hypothetical protein